MRRLVPSLHDYFANGRGRTSAIADTPSADVVRLLEDALRSQIKTYQRMSALQYLCEVGEIYNRHVERVVFAPKKATTDVFPENTSVLVLCVQVFPKPLGKIAFSRVRSHA